MAYPTGKPRGRRTMTTRTLPTETGRRVQECTNLASMTGEGPTVSSWGGVNKHTIPTCAPKPEDREALLPPPWSDGDDVRDITNPQGLTTQLCLPIVLMNQGVKESRPKQKLAMLDLVMMAVTSISPRGPLRRYLLLPGYQARGSHSLATAQATQANRFAKAERPKANARPSRHKRRTKGLWMHLSRNQ